MTKSERPTEFSFSLARVRAAMSSPRRASFWATSVSPFGLSRQLVASAPFVAFGRPASAPLVSRVHEVESRPWSVLAPKSLLSFCPGRRRPSVAPFDVLPSPAKLAPLGCFGLGAFARVRRLIPAQRRVALRVSRSSVGCLVRPWLRSAVSWGVEVAASRGVEESGERRGLAVLSSPAGERHPSRALAEVIERRATRRLKRTLELASARGACDQLGFERRWRSLIGAA